VFSFYNFTFFSFFRFLELPLSCSWTDSTAKSSLRPLSTYTNDTCITVIGCEAVQMWILLSPAALPPPSTSVTAGFTFQARLSEPQRHVYNKYFIKSVYVSVYRYSVLGTTVSMIYYMVYHIYGIPIPNKYIISKTERETDTNI
jgi:hypothetical protein